MLSILILCPPLVYVCVKIGYIQCTTKMVLCDTLVFSIKLIKSDTIICF